jgi:hypothetical protein
VTSGFNDSFANAQLIGGSIGTLNGSTLGATKEFGEPDHGQCRGQIDLGA